MQYMLLIYSEPGAEALDPQFDPETAMGEWFEYTQRLVDAGVLVSGEPLQGTETATTVRVRSGDRTVTDGPFAETKEVLGGYYLVDVDTVEDAQAWAAAMPAARYGSIEVRPLMPLPETAPQRG